MNHPVGALWVQPKLRRGGADRESRQKVDKYKPCGTNTRAEVWKCFKATTISHLNYRPRGTIGVEQSINGNSVGNLIL